MWNLDNFLNNSWYYDYFLYNFLDFYNFRDFNHFLYNFIDLNSNFFDSINISGYLNYFFFYAFYRFGYFNIMINDFFNFNNLRLVNNHRISEINLLYDLSLNLLDYRNLNCLGHKFSNFMYNRYLYDFFNLFNHLFIYWNVLFNNNFYRFDHLLFN